MDELGAQYPEAVLSLVAPDGFPFSVRVPISVDAAQRVRIGADALGVPVHPGPRLPDRARARPDFSWQRELPGARRPRGGGRRLGARPAPVVGGFELPPGSMPALRG